MTLKNIASQRRPLENSGKRRFFEVLNTLKEFKYFLEILIIFLNLCQR